MQQPEYQPWLRTYPAGMPGHLEVSSRSLIDAWNQRVAAHPEAPALRYFDGVLTAAQADRASSALAAALESRGTAKGDRVGIYLQNIPQYALALLALWKLGAIAVLLNPMYRRAELRKLIDDSGAQGIICTDTAVDETRNTLDGSTIEWIISTSERHFQTRCDPRAFPTTGRTAASADGDLAGLIAEFDGRAGPEVQLSQDDVALLVYTSGTTGPPKGAMNTHGNVLNVATTFGQWAALAPGDVVLAIAPLFHITGAVINGVISLISDTTLVFTGRFQPEVVLDAFAEHAVTYTIGSITVFNALFELEEATAAHFATVKTLYSGGAPIAPATIERFHSRFGQYIHNAYGMTETASGVIAVPPGASAPVDPASGALSIGVPLPNMHVRIVDPEGEPQPAGHHGELELSGPQVVPGYWRNSEASAQTMPEGRLRTGDVALLDEDGWVYLVDRLKDQINVSGFKVWPREVEDALYEHPAIHEAAVVGRPDDYQGESVIAFVSIKTGASTTEQELINFTRERLAAYKYPRSVRIVDELPKTMTGKIRRRELRGLESAAAQEAAAGAAATATATVRKDTV